MMERKKELRQQIAQEKSHYCISMLKELSVDILTVLERLPVFKDAQTVLLYHSLKDEVYTHDFIEKWSQTKKIILPVVVKDKLELRMYTTPQNLSIGNYGIAEPIGERFTEYEMIDVAVIPGIAFDRSGHRLGRGKGYYDKLLPHIPTIKIGVCFPFQLKANIPTEPFDISMDLVLTIPSDKKKWLSGK